MEIILGGSIYSTTIRSVVELSGARLYNDALNHYVEFAFETTESEDDYRNYKITLTPAQTAQLPIGVYNLELYSGSISDSTVEVVSRYKDYAVKERSSFEKEV